MIDWPVVGDSRSVRYECSGGDREIGTPTRADEVDEYLIHRSVDPIHERGIGRNGALRGGRQNGSELEMPSQTPVNLDDEERQVAAEWSISPAPPPSYGWPVFSADFVLAALQGCAKTPEVVRRTTAWLFLTGMLRGLMAFAQFLIGIAARIPVLDWCVEIMARCFTRNAFGFFLRACYWKSKLERLGQDTIIDQGVEIWGPSSVSIGSNCHIDTHVRLAAGERSQRQSGHITIGNYVHLGPGVHIAGRGGVTIGDLVGVSAGAHFYSATGVVIDPCQPDRLISMSHMAPRGLQHVVEGPIVVEDYCFIGIMARVFPGVRIGRGAIVHANCELTRDVRPFANVGGIARGRQIGWRRRPRIRPIEPSGPRAASASSNAAGTEHGD